MSKPYIIGISGGSGSGKTSVLRDLENNLAEENICVVSLDDYYKKREFQIVDENGVRNFDLPGSIDHEAFVRDIKALVEGKEVEREEYVFNNELAEPQKLRFCPAPIMLLEGLFIFHFEEIRDLIDLKVFVHAKENLKVIRRIKRDQLERNYPVDDVLYRYEKHVLPTFEAYIKPFHELADIVINNNTDYEKGVAVLEGFIRNKLGKVAQAIGDDLNREDQAG